jgi:hypothetical protein
MEKKITPITICVDFDGTCVTHEFPKVGRNIGAQEVLKELVANGHKLILFTMRSDIVNPTGEDNELHLESGNYLSDALGWFHLYEIPLYGVQVNPTQHTWTTSPKAYAQLYIDDAALGCPLLYGNFDDEGNGGYFERPHADWKTIREKLIAQGIIKAHQ